MKEGGLLTLVIFIFALCVLGFAMCSVYGTDEVPNKAASVVEAYGFKEPSVTAHGMATQWNGCSKSDDTWADVTATNPAGERVRLIVCCGLWLKACTVRVKP